MANPTRVVLDSCVLVNVLTENKKDQPEWRRHGVSVLSAVEGGKYEGFVSALTIAEVMANGQVRGNHLPKRERLRRIEIVNNWLRGSPLSSIEIDHQLAASAGMYGQKYQLKGADAIILSSAIRVKAHRLYSWDNDLLKLGHVEGVEIIEPSMHKPIDLFEVGADKLRR